MSQDEAAPLATAGNSAAGAAAERDGAVLAIDGLRKSYGALEAVRGLSLLLRRGEFYTLLGPNGAGKTTTLKTVAGLILPSAGTVRVLGKDVTREPELAKAALGYIPDRPYFYDRLTAREFLCFVGDLFAVPPAEREERMRTLLDRFVLLGRENEMIGSYSHGMKQKLAFCACFLHAPALVVVDEPWVGLDPRAIRTTIAFLNEECARGTTILMSTHTLALAQEVSHRTGIVHRGQIVAEGTVESLLRERSSASLEEVFLAMTEE